MERDLTWDHKHTIQHTNDILYNCIPESLYNLINQCHPNQLNFKKDLSKDDLFLKSSVL